MVGKLVPDILRVKLLLVILGTICGVILSPSFGWCESGAPVKIMCIGDSITQADANHASWRRLLWHRLTDADYDVDFVGSLTLNHNGAENPQPDFDLDHEGRWGWKIDQVLNVIDTPLSLYRPDMVLVHLGSNDMFKGDLVANAIQELSQLIDKIRQANPKAIILIAQVIPTNRSDRNERIVEFNSALPDLIGQKKNSQSPVIIVDQYEGFDGKTDTYDGVHPDESGEDKMAVKWFDALAANWFTEEDPNEDTHAHVEVNDDGDDLLLFLIPKLIQMKRNAAKQ
jgi:lysophospholipase L1-like esterase